jgi:hypothetical protein
VAIGAFEAFFTDMLLVAEDHFIGILGREDDIAAPRLFGAYDGRQCQTKQEKTNRHHLFHTELLFPA